MVIQFLMLVIYDILGNNDTFLYRKGNVAPITGYEIYAGTVKDCINLLTLSTSKEQITTAQLIIILLITLLLQVILTLIFFALA